MKYKILNKIVLWVLILAAFSACDTNNGTDPQPTDIYLVSYEKHKSYQVADMKTLLDAYAIIYPELKVIADNLQYGIDVYVINYKTTFKGAQIVASGLVSVPSSSGTFPLMSYQNGTNTLHSDAPTANPDNQLYLLLEFIASTGFVVAAPDYLGFGATSNMFHPYLEKESTVNSVIDMLRATNEFLIHYENAQPNNDLYIVGYSQGGWSTMQLQKAIEQQFSSEFNLIASSCGAGPYDLRFINDYILAQETYPMPFYAAYIFNSYINNGDITNQPGDIFQSPYDERVMTLFDGKHSSAEINARLTRTTADFFTPEYLSSSNTNEKFSSVIASLDKNSIPAWKTTTPTLITHGTADDYVPFQVSENMYNDFLAAGVNESQITFLPIEGANHSGGIIPSGVASFQWFIELNNSK